MKMSLPCRLVVFLVAFALAGLADATAQRPAAQFGPPVEVSLPALIDVESDAWLWTSFEGVEVLSLAPADVTRAVAENIALQRANIQALIPAANRITWDRPLQVILYGVENPRPMPLAFVVILQKKLTDQAREKALENRESKPLDVFVDPKIVPSTWVEDADQVSVFNIVAKLRIAELSALPAASYVEYLLQARRPPQPAWFVRGFTEFYSRATAVGRDLDLAPLVWVSRAQTQLMLRDKKLDPGLVPLSEVFAWNTAGQAHADERVRALHTSEAEILIRWVFEAKGPAGIDGLWRFVSGPTTGPRSEGRFQECLGMTPEAALAAMRTYLGTAMRKPARLQLRREARLPAIELRAATPIEIARVKSEWDRLGARTVGKDHPELRPFYLEQARRTLARVPAGSAEAPELLAARGLVAVDAGDDAAALPLLEQACQAPQPRPRAVVELARIRLAQARAAAGEAKLDAATVDSITQPLRSLVAFQPAMPLIYQVLAEAWMVAQAAPASADLDLLTQAVRANPTDVPMVIAVARLLIDNGQVDAAREVIDTGLAHVTDEGGRRRLFAIRSAVRAAAPR